MRFTIFTPTYNRAKTLPRVYLSLKKQTFKDFEWIIVDDGSTDKTESLVQEWIACQEFSIQYIRQENSGKHIAINQGLALAQGEFFLIADSDDEFCEEALFRFNETWETIQDKKHFSGITARCKDQHNNFIGTHLPKTVLDSDTLELQFVHNVHGEKWGFVKTSILRKIHCSNAANMGALPWAKIAAAGYKTRYVDIVLRTYYIDETDNALSKSLNHREIVTNVQVNLEMMNFAWKYFWKNPALFLKASVNLSRFSKASGLRFSKIMKMVKYFGARSVLFFAWLPSHILFPIKVKKNPQLQTVHLKPEEIEQQLQEEFRLENSLLNDASNSVENLTAL